MKNVHKYYNQIMTNQCELLELQSSASNVTVEMSHKNAHNMETLLDVIG